MSNGEEDGAESERPAATAADGVGWLVIGDYGYQGYEGREAVARKMEEVAAQEAIDFVVNSGDNVNTPTA